MIVALAGALTELGHDEEGRVNAENLLKAVEATRTGGGLIREFLDLEQNETLDKTKRAIHDTVRKATGQVAKNFATMLDHEFPARTGRVPVATIGYSTTVAACLDKAKDRISAVLILQCDEQTGEADDAMLADLEEMGIEAEIVDVTVNVGKRLEEVKVVLFGFEAASVHGELAHRQGLEAVLHPVGRFLNPIGQADAPAKGVKCAVGETWKVRPFGGQPGGKRKVPVRLIYHVQPPFRVVTDCDAAGGVHERRGPKAALNLSCCEDAWHRKLQAERRRRDPPHGDNGVEGAFG
jgi:hypothetical protein